MDPEQQMAAVLGSRPGAFATLISYLMSSDNKKRKKAESLFSLCRVHNPDVVALRLTHLLDSSLPQLRTMAAVLLRSHLISHGGGCDAGLSRLNAITKASIKSLLLAAVQREESKFLTKQLCDVVAEVAAALLPENEWPEFLPFMFQAVTSGSPHLQESSLLVFSRLSQCTRDPLLPHLASLHSVFLNSLSHPISSPDVRIAALGASINLVRCLPSAVDRDEFADLLPAMMLTLTEFLNSGNEAAAQEALKLLIELAGAEPKFLRRQLPHLVGSMLLIAEADALDESTRHLAIEFMITLAEARDGAPGMMRKLPQFIGRLFAVLMKMLLDIDDESTWHAAEEDDEDAWETDNYNFGQECLDRLSIAIGGTTIVPVAFELFPVYLASPDWQKHHAALITLALIAEGCSKVLIKNLEQVVTMALNSFQHPHPRVRWAAINAIRQLSTDLSPDLQAHAASVILNFTENCAPGILTHYLDGFVSKLLVLLQNKKPIVQGAALIALASLADSSREQFQNYYDAVMPCLKTILLNATVKSNRMLLAKSMECISLVGMVVGKDKFRDDAKQVMEVLMSLQGSQIEIDDPIASYMLQAWTRLCQCLGQDFLPYMNFVMPPLLQSAQLEPDVTITSADSEYMDNSNEDRVEIANFGDKRIRIRTRVLEEKATACSMLCCYADELKENFYPWIDQVAPTLVPLLKFYFDEEVRRAAVSAMPELLRSAKLAVEKGLAQGRDESYVKQLFDYIVPALVEALHKLSGHLLDKGQIRSIVDEIKHLITASTIRKRERAERMKAEDFDAEEGEFLKEENEQEEEVFDQVSDCLGTMIKTFKTYFVPFLDELSVYLKPMWGRDKTPKERRIAICIFDDVAEQCQESALKYYDTYLPFLIEACNDGDAGVRRAAVYGIGVCAEFGGLVFRPFVGEALYRLNNVIRNPDVFSSNTVLAYDAAVSALGKICLFHRDSIDAAQVLCAGKGLATEQTVSRMIRLLKQLQQTMPPPFLASLLSSLPPHQQLALQSAMSS
ncbi:hypothetical protein MA16_Dca020059 [Dendrobium catenatum]|uniref:TOG domain-containing protein n=1 Tax=Dendrobium catenatum TaxID=906689 RepID=A0A2I0XJK7_9ASPA|nr:hypothetical protein MA16_Dca020059 [Dendrobium catenatum]